MQLFELLLALFADIARIGSKRILHASIGLIDSLLDLGGTQIMPPSSLGKDGLTLHQLFNQSGFSLGSPTLEIQMLAHSSLLVWSNNKLSRISGVNLIFCKFTHPN